MVKLGMIAGVFVAGDTLFLMAFRDVSLFCLLFLMLGMNLLIVALIWLRKRSLLLKRTRNFGSDKSKGGIEGEIKEDALP